MSSSTDDLSPTLLQVLSTRVGVNSLGAMRLMPCQACLELLPIALESTDANLAVEAFSFCRRALVADRQVASAVVTEKDVCDKLMRYVLCASTPPGSRKVAAECVAAAAVKAQAGWPHLWPEVSRALNDATTGASVASALLAIVQQGCLFLAPTLRASLGTLLGGACACVTRFHQDEVLVKDGLYGLSGLILTANEKDAALVIQSPAASTFMTAMMHDSPEVCSMALHWLSIFAAERFPLLASHVPQLLQDCLVLLRRTDTQLPSKARNDVFLLIIALANGDPPKMKKRADFLAQFVDVAFDFVVTRLPEPTDNWKATAVEDFEANARLDAATTAIGELGTALRWKALDVLTTACVESNVASPEWRRRAAALIFVMDVFTVSEKQKPKLALTIQQHILPCIESDASPVVRWAALRCLWQCVAAIADAPVKAILSIQYVLPVMGNVGLYDPAPRVRALAVNVITKYFEKAFNVTEQCGDAGPFASIAPTCMRPLLAICASSARNCLFAAALRVLNMLVVISGDASPPTADLVSLFTSLLAGDWVTEVNPDLQLLAVEGASRVAQHLDAENKQVLLSRVIELQRVAEAEGPTGRAAWFVAEAWRRVLSTIPKEAARHADAALPMLIAFASAEDVSREEVPIGGPVVPPPVEYVTVQHEVVDGRRFCVSFNKVVRVTKASALLSVAAWLGAGTVNLDAYFEGIVASAVPVLARRDVEDLPAIGSVVLDELADALQSEGDAGRQHSFVQLVLPAFAFAMTEGRLAEDSQVKLMARLAEWAASDDANLHRLVPLAIEAVRNYICGVIVSSSDKSQTGEPTPEERRFPMRLAMLIALFRVSDVAKLNFARKIFPLARALTSEAPSPSVTERVVSLLVLATFVVYLPAQAKHELSSIADVALSLAAHDSVPRVIKLAFSLCGLIMPQIAAVAQATPEARNAAAAYATALLSAAGTRLQVAVQQLPAHPPFAPEIVLCVTAVKESFPEVIAAAPDSAAQLEVLLEPFRGDTDDDDDDDEDDDFE